MIRDMILAKLGLVRLSHYEELAVLHAQKQDYLLSLLERTPHQWLKEELRDVLYQTHSE